MIDPLSPPSTKSVPAQDAGLRLHPLFSEGAVLQRGQPVPVWGIAAPGERVSVMFAGQTACAVADSSGGWLLHLAPLEASAEPRDLVARATSTVIVRDVVVGDVWLASGQSNMDAALASGSAAQALPHATDPLLRFVRVPKATAVGPQTEFRAIWQAATPETARLLSAVGYFFARELRRSQGVPQALLHSAWGGTPIKTWMSLPSLEAPAPSSSLLSEWESARAKHLANAGDEAGLQAYYAERRMWEQEAEKPHREALSAWEARAAAAAAAGLPAPSAPPPPRAKPSTPDPFAMPAPGTSDRPAAPTACFNAMIAPCAPYALKGVLWYQGEADSSDGLAYRDLLLRLIKGWRVAWRRDDLPFLIVQLPGYGRDEEVVSTRPTSIAWLREAQDLALKLPFTGLAVTLDLGDAADVHPDNKIHVGRRLALLAREKVYGEAVVGSGPRLVSHEVAGGAVRLRFAHTGTGLRPGRAPWLAKGAYPIPDYKLLGFFVAGADRLWFEAEARIEGDTVVVSSPAVPAPQAVRYGWGCCPRANLYNREGLPAAPFRTDSWPG